MEEKILYDAAENISIIRGVIERTSKSFVAFSKIFIYWGLLFIPVSIISLFIQWNQSSGFKISEQYLALSYFLPLGVIAICAALIFRGISKKIPLIGFEKHLMKVWLLILLMQNMPSRVGIIADTGIDTQTLNSITILQDTFSILLFSLAIGLILTALLTNYKQPMYVGAVYICMSMLHAYFNLAIFNVTSIQLLTALLLPFTFLYLGFYLKSKQVRGD